MNEQARVRRWGADLQSALAYPITSISRVISAILIAIVTYVFLILSTFPEMSIQMLGSGLQWFDDTMILLTENVLATNGWFGLALIISYAVLTGVAIVNIVAQLSVTDISSLPDLIGVLPGLIASGCASCGAGLLGFLGFAGAMAAMPFHGDLLRVGGIILLLAFLARAGDPRECGLNI
ncbi:hypothetical protein [Haladaptatus sp. DFWS20]|uniref:hypothetical protein n=1 Tax=Haladaptatus sp. DFWS20 TaxID=3403467 RepID=UPI003EBE6A22